MLTWYRLLNVGSWWSVSHCDMRSHDNQHIRSKTGRQSAWRWGQSIDIKLHAGLSNK